jgi:hypothetical protein
MTSFNSTKCAHITCLCDVKDENEYCSEACRARGRYDVEIACQCDHLDCPCVVVAVSVMRQSRHEEN